MWQGSCPPGVSLKDALAATLQLLAVLVHGIAGHILNYERAANSAQHKRQILLPRHHEVAQIIEALKPQIGKSLHVGSKTIGALSGWPRHHKYA